jgi:hypothetical protein
MEVENTRLWERNVELISMMDALAGKMKVMQRRWDSQCSFVHHSCIEEKTHVPNRHSQPEASVKSPLQRICDARKLNLDAPSVRILDVPTRPVAPPQSAATPTRTIIVEAAPHAIILPLGTIVNVTRTCSTPKTALRRSPAYVAPTIKTPLNQSTPVIDVRTPTQTEPDVLTPAETQPALLTPIDDVLTDVLSTPPDVVGVGQTT